MRLKALILQEAMGTCGEGGHGTYLIAIPRCEAGDYEQIDPPESEAPKVTMCPRVRAGEGKMQTDLKAAVHVCDLTLWILLLGAHVATYECSPCSDLDHLSTLPRTKS